MHRVTKELEQYITDTETYLKDTVVQLLSQALPELTEEKFALFEKKGNRLMYEGDYFAKRKFLTVFGVAVQWMKEWGHGIEVQWMEAIEHGIEARWQDMTQGAEKVVTDAIYQKLEEILLSVCEEECWALPAHVNRQENPDWRNTIDLFAAETAQTLLDIVDTVGNKLSDRCQAVVRAEVQKRVLQPFFESAPGTYGWERCDNNWNAVCNGSIGSAYLHSLVEGEAPKKQYITRICDNLLHYVEGFAEDGTCMEGLGYYFYGMTYFVNFARELFETSKGQMDLLHGSWGEFRATDIEPAMPAEAGINDKRMRIAKWWRKCYFEGGLTVSFSDGSSREKCRMGLACLLAQSFGEMQLPPPESAMTLEEDACYRYLPFKQDVFATREYKNILLQGSRKKEKVGSTLEAVGDIREECKEVTRWTHILPTAQWCIAQTYVETQADEATGVQETQKKRRIFSFACKGGHNGESHNHNDVGSFLYMADGEMFLTDLGAGEYTKEYFGAGRYHILCKRSLGHNVPLIAGGEQLDGAEYGCKEFLAEEDLDSVKVSMDLEEVYAQEVLRSFGRSITFEKHSGECMVTDVFESAEEITVTENLVTQIVPQVKDTEVWLEGQKGICKIQTKPALVPGIITMEHSNHQGNKEQVYLIQWKVSVKNKAQLKIHISI